jgi:hypothetical protein
MIIVAGGDSFIWGSELVDSPHGGPNGYSHNTFTALLAKNYDYVCAAYPGNANNAISRMVIAACEQISNDKFLIVNWTYSQRVEFRINDKWVSINSWHTNLKEFSESYFKNVGNSEYYEVYSILKEILFLQQYCEIHKIPYLFTTADNHFYQHENYIRCRDADIDNLYNNINWDNWFWFPPGIKANETVSPRGFYQWAVENKYSMGPAGHPLEQAHADAALLIKEKFNELVTKSLQSN